MNVICFFFILFFRGFEQNNISKHDETNCRLVENNVALCQSDGLLS